MQHFVEAKYKVVIMIPVIGKEKTWKTESVLGRVLKTTCGQPKDLIRPQIWTVNQPITKKASVSNSKDFPSQGLATFFL